ncbi:hypothetical protein V8B97DRAFT_2025593 [Scleroderma yunnanense]
MQAPSEELVTQFTEDTFAKEDRVCQWSWCQALIHRGDPLLPDPQHIHWSISIMQSQSSVNCPLVIAMSNTALNPGNLSLPPGGPSIHVPSTWQKVPQPANPRPSGHVMTLPPGSTGYSAQHMHYVAQHEHWACMAHNPPPAETISLEIWAVFGAREKKRTYKQTTSNICEGLKDINVLSTACELAAIALETVVLCIKVYFPQFHCNQKGLKGMVFKPKQFTLFIVMPANQWEEFKITPTHT